MKMKAFFKKEYTVLVMIVGFLFYMSIIRFLDYRILTIKMIFNLISLLPILFLIMLVHKRKHKRMYYSLLLIFWSLFTVIITYTNVIDVSISMVYFSNMMSIIVSYQVISDVLHE